MVTSATLIDIGEVSRLLPESVVCGHITIGSGILSFRFDCDNVWIAERKEDQSE